MEPSIVMNRKTVENAAKIAIAVVIMAVLVYALLTFKDGTSLAEKGSSSEMTRDLRGSALIDITGENIVLMDSSANIFDESNFQGRVYLLVFYDNQCAECKKSQEAVQKVRGKFMKAPLQVVYIFDGRQGTFESFQQGDHKRYFRLYDEDGRFTRALEVKDNPAEMLIDHNGIIRNISYGLADQNLIASTSEIDSLVRLVPADSSLVKR
jgi:cytochrome oxidase Cu insertion factor (SCO1/SenC/PrrC family)